MMDASTIFKSSRFQSEKRELAGLLLALGFATLILKLGSIVAAFNNGSLDGGATPTEGIGLANLVGGICEFAIGVFMVLAAYADLVHDVGHRLVYALIFVFVQTA